MTTTIYLRRGRRRPYHLADSDGQASLCGEVRWEEPEVFSLAVAPSPLSEATVCGRCLALSHSLAGKATGPEALP